ncbi:hypothetical protein [Streptomyces sp. 8N706]|uniref:hypothetical protein n=1 Tax=Streptomyces sp. 8N706 TaxID=3457416 RepID=UPI003FD2D7FD
MTTRWSRSRWAARRSAARIKNATLEWRTCPAERAVLYLATAGNVIPPVLRRFMA